MSDDNIQTVTVSYYEQLFKASQSALAEVKQERDRLRAILQDLSDWNDLADWDKVWIANIIGRAREALKDGDK